MRYVIKAVSRKRRAISAHRYGSRARVGPFTNVSVGTAGALDYFFCHFPATMTGRYFPGAFQAYMRLAKDERRDPVWNRTINAADQNLSKIKRSVSRVFDTDFVKEWERENRDFEGRGIGSVLQDQYFIRFHFIFDVFFDTALDLCFHDFASKIDSKMAATKLLFSDL